MHPIWKGALAALLLGASGVAVAGAASPTVAGLLAGYEAAGAGPFDAARGARLWTQATADPATGQPRTCATCHGEDLRKAGKHAKTGEVIDAMAPSANAERYTDPAFVEKWFGRNCKWTFGRECTPQEKGDFLLFLTR